MKTGNTLHQQKSHSLELDETDVAVARDNPDFADIADCVDVIVGLAAESAQQLVEADVDPFDLVLIDADEPSSPIYLAAALQLPRRGAVIVIDNVVRDETVIEPDSDDPRVHRARQVMTDTAPIHYSSDRHSDGRGQRMGRSDPPAKG